jgi:hypothetical protein
MKGDRAVDSGADKLEDLSGKAAAKGGLGAKVANELADDAAFLRKLKPSLIAKRAKGELPTPSGPQHAKPKRTGGPNPFVVAGAAFGIGTLIAKLIDWRGHAHPRR